MNINIALLLIASIAIQGISDAQADEVSELKSRLSKVEEERQELLHKIQSFVPKEKIIKPAKANHATNTKAAIKLYRDSRGFNTIELATSANDLPLGISFWGFTDLHGTPENNNTMDLDRYFMEYRLSRAIDAELVGGIKGLGVQLEFNDVNGPNNQVLRFGLTYKHSIPTFTSKGGWLQWRGFPVESDGSGQQSSVIYYFPLAEKLWLSGFADLNHREHASNEWVVEPQLNYRILDGVNLIAEYRYSGFDGNTIGRDANGVAVGFDFKF